MEAIRSSETSLYYQIATRCHNPENDMNLYGRENLKSRIKNTKIREAVTRDCATGIRFLAVAEILLEITSRPISEAIESKMAES